MSISAGLLPWEPSLARLHSPAWWRRHGARSGILDVEVADTMSDGWRRWLDWQHAVSPDNTTEIDVIGTDAGRHLGYVRAVGRLRADTVLDEPIAAIPVEYVPAPLRRPNDH